jgi:hypothetical protein
MKIKYTNGQVKYLIRHEKLHTLVPLPQKMCHCSFWMRGRGVPKLGLNLVAQTEICDFARK